MEKIASYHYYDVILAVFTAMLLVSNLTATKLIAFGPIITDGGALLFPFVYVFGDVFTEVYGYRYARKAIWTGFGVMLLAVLSFTIVGAAPGADAYTSQEAYEAVLGFFPRIVAASLIAYLVGSFINAYVLARIKLHMHGQRLWLRLIASTLVGQFFDTLVFGIIAFWGILSMGEMINFLLVGWLFKTLVEVILLPATYRVVRFLKAKEHSDASDANTDFSPFNVND